jgi:hypothetical protein
MQGRCNFLPRERLLRHGPIPGRAPSNNHVKTPTRSRPHATWPIGYENPHDEDYGRLLEAAMGVAPRSDG